MRERTLLLVGIFTVLFVVSSSVAADRAVRPSLGSAEASSLPAPHDREVLFGTYSCRVSPGVGLELKASFSSTGNLVPAPTANLNESITLYFDPLNTENFLAGDASFARCESLAAEVEQWLQSNGCTVGSPINSSVPDELVGFRYVCEDVRNRLVHVIGGMGRNVLGATL